MIVVIQCQYTSKITGIAHIHRIGNGSDGRTGIILSGLQVLIEYVIAVVGRYKTLHRQTHALAEQTGRYIAKVTARHTYHHIIRLTFFLQLCVGIEIIECLRQETGHVNRICRSQFHVRIQVSIHKRILHQCLTIVKRTVYFQSRNILSQRSELLFLNFADLSFGIKHIHMDTFHSQEAIGYCTAGISRSSDQDIHLLLPFFFNEVTQQTSHEPSAHVLKSQGRTMKQFQ